MDYDLHRGMRDLGSVPAACATRLPVEHLLRRAHRRRAARVTALGAIGATTAAALALGSITLTGDLHPDPAPPVVVPTQSATNEPDPTQTPAPTTSPEPDPEPEPVESLYEPDLSPCGTTRDLDMYDPNTDLTVYDPVMPNPEPGVDVHTVVSFGTSHRWTGDRVSVAPLEAVLTDADHLGTGAEWTVVAVPAAPLRAPAAEVLVGGDAGASASLDMDIPFVMCPGTAGAGSTPPAGSYNLWFQGRMVHDGTTLINRGVWAVTVGPVPEQPSLVDSLDLPPLLDMPAEQYRLDLDRCGSSTSDLDAIASTNLVVTGGKYFSPDSGYTYWYLPVRSGLTTVPFFTTAGWHGDPDLDYWPRSESSQVTILDAVVAGVTPGDRPIWGKGPNLTPGPVAGLLSGPVTPVTRTGALTRDLPITWCDGSTTVPDGQWVLYAKVQENVSGTDDAPWSSTGIYWVAQVLAVGPDAYPGTWPY